MGYTNETARLRLPQYVPEDKPTYLGDMNQAYAKIDETFSTLIDRINAQGVQLDGMSSGSALLAFLTSVDGSGSGLDSDTVDGKHASEFASNAALSTISNNVSAIDTKLTGSSNRLDSLTASITQLSAIIECADAAHGLRGHIISDGGCKIPGDVAKAFGGGADFVMLGGMFAGHDESGGDIVEEHGKKFRLFYGMSSQTAMDKHAGGVAEYRASEGKTVKVPYKGPVSETVKDILGGVRSTCTYVGASELRELSKRTTFIRVAEQHNEVFGNS